MEKVLLTARSARVLEILKATGAKMFSDQIAEQDVDAFANGAKTVNPIMTHLVKAGYVAKEKSPRTVVSKDGNEITKEYTLYYVTPVGAELVYEIKSA